MNPTVDEQEPPLAIHLVLDGNDGLEAKADELAALGRALVIHPGVASSERGVAAALLAMLWNRGAKARICWRRDDILDDKPWPMTPADLEYWVRKLYDAVSSQSGAIARLQKQVAETQKEPETVHVELPIPQPKDTDPIIGIEMGTGKLVRDTRPNNRSIADREMAMWKSYTVFPPKMGSTIDLLYANADGLEMELAALAEEGLDSHGNAVYWRDHDEFKP